MAVAGAIHEGGEAGAAGGPAGADEGRDFYPPGPAEVAPLGEPPGYKARVVLVLGSLLLFVALYFGLLAGSAYLVYFTFVGLPWLPGKGVLLNLGAVAGAAMLFLFLLKGLFHRREFSAEGLVEVSEAEQPRLFDFLRKLCRDAGSPMPGKVYLSHEVNAAVSYPRSLLSLVWPVRKDLVIGLGLVAALDLSELKAVLAHEFGHFSQSSMRLGQYVYVANGVVADVVFKRDRWDDALRTWMRQDVRVSFPAWAIAGVVWALRKVLELAFRGINLANFSLSRQMEFDADLRAVRLAGSDAIVSGLWKAERAALAYDHAFSGLASVAEHGKFSADVFAHVEGSLGRLEAHFAKVQGAEERLGPLLARYERGPKLHFSSPVEKVSALWESHPPNHEREANVKRVYVAAPADERPALALFEGGRALRERLSRLAYEAKGFSPQQALPAREVAGLVEEESGEMHQPAHYHGLYEDRVVRPGDVEAVARKLDAEAEAGTLDPAALRAEAAEFTGEALAGRMARLAELQAESGLVEALRDGRAKLKGKTAKFRGRDLTRAEILALEGEIDAELKAAHEALERADRAVFRHHYARSAGDPEARRELVHRYKFLLAVQDLIVPLNAAERRLEAALAPIKPGAELTEHEVNALREAASEARSLLAHSVGKAKSIEPPRLALLDGSKGLDRFVLPEPVVEALGLDPVTGAWLGQLLGQFGGALRRLRKLHFKNLGALLALGERIDPELFAAPGGEGAAAREGAAESASAREGAAEGAAAASEGAAESAAASEGAARSSAAREGPTESASAREGETCSRSDG